MHIYLRRSYRPDPVSCSCRYYIATGSDDATAKVWNLTTGECIYTLKGHTGRICSVAVAGNYVITGSDDGTAKVWNLTTGECIYTLKGHTDSIWSVAVAGNYIVTGSNDATVRVWDLSICFDAFNKSKISFLAGQHVRAGANSALKHLSPYIMREILEYVWPKPKKQSSEQQSTTSSTSSTSSEPVQQEKPTLSIVEQLLTQGIANEQVQQLQHIKKTHSELMAAFNKLPKECQKDMAESIKELDSSINDIIKGNTNLLELFYSYYKERNYLQQERIQAKIEGYSKTAFTHLDMLSALIRSQRNKQN